MEMFVTELDWSQASPLSYEEALERAVREFSGQTVDVTSWRLSGEAEMGFIGTFAGVDAYDEEDPPTIGLDFGAGVLVLSREAFVEAAWLEQPGPVTTDRALRFTFDDRHIEVTTP